MMLDVELDMLPASFRAILHKGRFLVAYHLPVRGRYVAQYIQSDGQRRELEYDVASQCCLTLDERRAELPGETREPWPEEGLTILTRYFLADELEELRVQFDAVDDSGGTVVSRSVSAYVPTVWDGKQLIQEALHRQRFPARYAALTRSEQVTFWAQKLLRFRRAKGESGCEENAIYTPALIEDMEKIDPHVRQLLPEILGQLATLEQTEASETFASFSAGTGVLVSQPLPTQARRMAFEYLILRPETGPCDVEAITAWLNARPFTFLDPFDKQLWHLSTNAQTAASDRHALLVDHHRFSNRVHVTVFPDRIGVSVMTSSLDQVRALEFLVWLASRGAWTVALDRGAAQPLGDPRRLFPAGLHDPDDLDHDALLLTPVNAGCLLTWKDHVRPGREFVAHTDGPWRLYSGERVLRGQLTQDARDTLEAALATVDSDDFWTDDFWIRDAETAPATTNIEDADRSEFVAFDPESPPASCRALVALVVAWLDALEGWSPGGVVEGFASIRQWLDPSPN